MRLKRNLNSDSQGLLLSEFLFFRLNRLAAAVSEYLAVIYREEFDLDIPAWLGTAESGVATR
jgi:hypothetical protein